MANELARQMSSEALRDFNQIDVKHTGGLNLVDIARYETKGAEQKKVATFLEDNFKQISTPVFYDFNSNQVRADGINRSDLTEMLDFSDTQKAGDLKKQEASYVHQQEIGGAAEGGALGFLPAIGLGAITAMVFAPTGAGAVVGAAAAFAGMEALSTAVVSASLHYRAEGEVQDKQKAVDAMKL